MAKGAWIDGYLDVPILRVVSMAPSNWIVLVLCTLTVAAAIASEVDDID